MFRTLYSATNKKFTQPQIYRNLVHSVEKSKVSRVSTQTINNPQNLPLLPVPKLANTFEKYLKSVRPFLSEDEFKKTITIVKEFTKPNGRGEKLQKYLEDKANKTSNWLADWWLDVAYLEYRDPVVVYSSPGQTIPFQEFKDEEERVAYCAKLIVAAATYKMLIDKKQIPMDKMGKYELDMEQYMKIFGTCRIPGLVSDKLQYHPTSRHIIVVHNNHFFKMNIFNSKNLPLSEYQTSEQLKKIIIESPDVTVPVGILTSDNRNNWANAYKIIMEDPLNKNTVEEIQKSLFLVCLDKPMPTFENENRQTFASRLLIHGGGSMANSANRWYDKTVQFVLGVDGTVGLTYEHSPAEGQPIAVMVDYLDQFIRSDSAKKIPDVSDINLIPTELKFQLNEDIKSAIDHSKQNIDELSGNLDMECFTYEKFGKEFIKSQKLSPDSFIQIAIQYAFYRIHRVPGAHYESAATRKYLAGRTETIRSCSTESVAFAKAMLDNTKNNQEKYDALKTAVNAHKQYASEAVNGFGVDRHLLGLKLAAKELNLDLPMIFKDSSYTRSSHMRLSTSQVATNCDAFMCYGPLTEDGYGCCYNPRTNTINFGISAFKKNPQTSAKNFASNLTASLQDMQNLLINQQQSKI